MIQLNENAFASLCNKFVRYSKKKDANKLTQFTIFIQFANELQLDGN